VFAFGVTDNGINITKTLLYKQTPNLQDRAEVSIPPSLLTIDIAHFPDEGPGDKSGIRKQEYQ
jgi:hypothetical protein